MHYSLQLPRGCGNWYLGNPQIVFQEIWQDINMHAFIAEAQRYSLICKRIKNAVHSFYHNHKMKPGTLLKELSCLNETECCAHGVNEAILLGCIWLSSECLKYVGVCCSRYCPSLQPDYTTNGCAGGACSGNWRFRPNYWRLSIWNTREGWKGAECVECAITSLHSLVGYCHCYCWPGHKQLGLEEQETIQGWGKNGSLKICVSPPFSGENFRWNGKLLLLLLLSLLRRASWMMRWELLCPERQYTQYNGDEQNFVGLSQKTISPSRHQYCISNHS